MDEYQHLRESADADAAVIDDRHPGYRAAADAAEALGDAACGRESVGTTNGEHDDRTPETHHESADADAATAAPEMVTAAAGLTLGVYMGRDAERVALALALATIPYLVERVEHHQTAYRFRVPVAMGSRSWEVLRGMR